MTAQPPESPLTESVFRDSVFTVARNSGGVLSHKRSRDSHDSVLGNRRRVVVDLLSYVNVVSRDCLGSIILPFTYWHRLSPWRRIWKQM